MKNLSFSTKYLVYKEYLPSLHITNTKMNKEANTVNSEKNSISESCLKTLPSTNFMKMLLVNIIENVFFSINICIGIFVIISHEYSERTFIYALGLLILPFMINILIAINECFYKTELVQTNQKYERMKIILTMLLLQHLPLLLLLVTMCGLDFQENYTRRLTIVNSRRSIIYSCSNNITLVFLLLRGVITLDNRTCLVDDLGRSACIIYPVVLIIVIGILVTVIHLHKILSLDTFSMPITLIVIIYRTIAFSLIISYLDFWSIIPIVIIYLSGMMITIKSEKQGSNNEKDEIDGAKGLVWDGDEWIGLQTSIESNLTKTVYNVKPFNNTKFSSAIEAIINSFCHLKYETQLFYPVDILIITVLLVIMYLVNISENFNYEYNILENSSFNLLCFMLLFFGIIKVVLSKMNIFLYFHVISF